MMTLLDTAERLIQRLLSVLPAEARDVLWFPLLVVVVFIGMRLLVRKAVPWLGRLAGVLVRSLVAVVGATLLVPEFVAATAFRQVGIRPPGLVYGYGDAVAETMIKLGTMAGATTSALARVARMNITIVLLLGALWLWAWNQSHCRDVVAGAPCERPVAQWMAALNS